VQAGHVESLYSHPVRSLIHVDPQDPPADTAAFLAAVAVATDLVRRPEVVRSWSEESACSGMSVGALARHLVSQWFNAERLLAAPAGAESISVWEHYQRAAWAHTSLDDEANAGIRQGSEELAAAGPQDMLDLVETLEPRLVAMAGATRAGSVTIPWQGWSLSPGGFLLTRMMEVVVHSDDLASSVGLETPEFPDQVVTPVLGLLTGLAVRRHGQHGVLRTLTRPQRAPSSVSAF
jgi:Mycothiol maleylpyruvate isomerase N-terminal domain